MLEKRVIGLDDEGGSVTLDVVFEMAEDGRFSIVSGTLGGVPLRPVEDGMKLWCDVTRRRYRLPEFEKLLLTRNRPHK